MNFKINNDDHSDKSYQKLENIFEHIEEKLSIALNDFMFEKMGVSYFKMKVNDETCFKEKIKPTLILKEGRRKKLLQKKVKLILLQKKTLCIPVEYYFKCNLFSLKLKIKMIA